MIILTDGIKTVEIKMTIWDEANSRYTPDFADEFFNVGGLDTVEMENGDLAYKVADVEYCIEQAIDWKYGQGDFCEDQELNFEDDGYEFNPENRCVDTYDITPEKGKNEPKTVHKSSVAEKLKSLQTEQKNASPVTHKNCPER